MILPYTDRSKDDIELAFAWYEKQRRGLGFEFLDCVEMSLKNILTFPEMYNLCYSNFRRALSEDSHFQYFTQSKVKKL
ncbi:recombinase [Candidatus Brocadia pituitae]|nr:recombinase [Candidatus Brocadia pituitae]